MISVLFVCTGNQYRSPLAAAAFLRQLRLNRLTDQWMVGSAGTWTTPDLPAFPKAVQLAQDLGLDIAGHRTCLVAADELSNHDLILVMESGQKEALCYEFHSVRNRVHMLSEVVNGVSYDIPDPADPRVNAKAVAIELCDLVERGFLEICKLAESKN